MFSVRINALSALILKRMSKMLSLDNWAIGFVCMFSVLAAGSDAKTIEQIMAEKYGFEFNCNLSPVIQLIEQTGPWSWLHVVWANISRHYASGLTPGRFASVDRSALGCGGWWRENNSWVQDADVQMAMMRLLLDTDMPLAKAFFARQEKTKFFTMRKKLQASICGRSGVIKDKMFFDYAKAFKLFLGSMREGERLELLEGVYGCPGLYWKVLDAVDAPINVIIDSENDFADRLSKHWGSLISFLTLRSRVLAGVWHDFLTRRKSELVFRVRVDGDHWLLFVLTIDSGGTISGVWYDSRPGGCPRAAQAFEKVVRGALEVCQMGDEGWEEVEYRMKYDEFCAMKLVAYNLIFDQTNGDLTIKIHFDFSTKPVAFYRPGDCLDGYAVGYITKEQFFKMLKKCSFLFPTLNTRPGFPQIKAIKARIIEIVPDLGPRHPVEVKIQWDKERIVQFNQEFAGKKGFDGQDFKPMCSRQSFFFPQLHEFIEFIEPPYFLLKSCLMPVDIDED